MIEQSLAPHPTQLIGIWKQWTFSKNDTSTFCFSTIQKVINDMYNNTELDMGPFLLTQFNPIQK